MRSIRTKIVILNVLAVTLSIAASAIVGTISIANFAHEDAKEKLSLLCETGKKQS